jgi:hypothetical protein
MRINVWSLLLGGLALCLLYLLYTLMEPYEEAVDRGWSDAARRNPFLAAEQFLTRSGVMTESSDRLDVMDTLGTDATLVIGNANHVLTRQRALDLISWMERGGHIIVAAQFYDEDQPDVLLSEFEVTKHESEIVEEPAQNESSRLRGLFLQASEDAQQELQQAKAQEESIRQQLSPGERLRLEESFANNGALSSLAFEGIDYGFTADFRGSGSLSHPWFYTEEGEEYDGERPFYWAGNDRAITFMQLYVGEGMLTVLADADIWNSGQVGHFDHAFLLQTLTEESGQVVLLYGALVPTLWEIIWRHFPELVIVLLVLLAAWTLHRTRRFGPLIETDNSTRRSYREHIQAVGNFFWRRQMSDQLLAAARRDLWQLLAKRSPESQQLSESEKLRRFASVTGISVEALRTLMLGPVPVGEFKFLQSVQSLQEIRKSL